MRARSRLSDDQGFLGAIYGLIMAGLVLAAIIAAGAGFAAYSTLSSGKRDLGSQESAWLDALHDKTETADALRDLASNLSRSGKLPDGIDFGRALNQLETARTRDATIEAAQNYDGVATRILSAAESEAGLTEKALATRAHAAELEAEAAAQARRYLNALDAYNAQARAMPGSLVGPYFGFDPIAEPTVAA